MGRAHRKYDCRHSHEFPKQTSHVRSKPGRVTPSPGQPQYIRRRRVIPGLSWLQDFWDPFRLIEPPERPLLVERPTVTGLVSLWFRQIITCFVAFLLLGLATPERPEPSRIAIVLLFIAAAQALLKFGQWGLTVYIITNQRIIHVSGLIRRRYASIPLQMVTDISFTQSIFERMFNFGVVHIHSANEQSAFRELRWFHNPKRFYDELMLHIGIRSGYSFPEIGQHDLDSPPGRNPWWKPPSQPPRRETPYGERSVPASGRPRPDLPDDAGYDESEARDRQRADESRPSPNQREISAQPALPRPQLELPPASLESVNSNPLVGK